MINIILADDHQLLREGLASLLGAEETINVVLEASNGKEVLDFLEDSKADIALLDINMLVLDGIQTTMTIKKEHPEVKVLIVSMHNKEGFVKNAIEVGADGYVLKNVGKQELLKAIDHIMNGGTYFSQEVTQTLISHMRVDQPNGLSLTAKEKNILIMLSDGNTTPEIAEKLVLSHHTIDSYRRNLLLKFKVKNVSELIKISMKEGFIS